MVSLLKCNNYEYENVKDTIIKSFENLGGIEKFIKKGAKVLLKVNLLMKKEPHTATTTNPVFVQALADVLIAYGAVVTIGDSPGGPYTANALKAVYRVCGMQQVADATGATLNYDVSYKTKPCSGVVSGSFEIIQPILDADVVISVAKLKTHQFATYTGAVKNLFGAVPGLYKAEYHLRMPNIDEFSEMLVDLCEAVSPTLSFIDGIIGMEGAGPSAGTPREIGVVLASANPHKADKVACSIIGLDVNNVGTLKAAQKRGFLDDLTIVGDSPFVIKDYVIPMVEKRGIVFKMLPFISKMFSAKPVVFAKNCIGCADCAKNCPAKAIEMKNNIPNFDYKKCFRCYCCQELCPKSTIVVKRNKFFTK